MSSTAILINKTSVPYRLNTKPILDGASPWPHETYFIQNIVSGPNQTAPIVQVNRDIHIKHDVTYILKSTVTTRDNQVLFSVSVKVVGTLFSSDISAKLDDSTGTKTTGWITGKGSIVTTLNGQTYTINIYWVSNSPSLFDNLEIHLKKD